MHSIKALLLGSLALYGVAQGDERNLLTRGVANNVALLAMMASNVYVGDTENIYFPLETLG